MRGKTRSELKNNVYDCREDGEEKPIEFVEKIKPEADGLPEGCEKNSECPQMHQNSGKGYSGQEKSITPAASCLPKRHFFDDTQVNLLFQVFLCHRNEQTGQWDDPETIQMMVDQLNVYSLEQ